MAIMKSMGRTFHVLAIIVALLLSVNLVQGAHYLFWINNNFDRWILDAADGTNYMDDLESTDVAGLPAYERVPDCNYVNASGRRVIPCTRDLEDFAPLLVAGVTPELIDSLSTNSTITLNWTEVTGNPTIDLFAAAAPGQEYLTNETTAIRQIDPAQCPYIGRISPTNQLQFTKNTWPKNQFIWCGVSNGYGGLQLTITDGNGNSLAQTTVYIQLVDIKQMYERWTVGENPEIPPLTDAFISSDFISANSRPFRYPPPGDTNTPYILFVHGWNMNPEEKDLFAECAFKRLYWQGYHGRFGSFRWPTAHDFGGVGSGSHNTLLNDPKNFDNSESNAWASAGGLLKKLTELNTLYPGHVYLLAHSMGCVVAGEALRLAGNRLVANTYVAMQGAVSAHCYDQATANRRTFNAPDCYARYWTGNAPCYFNGAAGAGTYVNFYNPNDYALSRWQIDQNWKPDFGYLYSGDHFSRGTLFTTPLLFPQNTYEIFAYADPARSFALGAQADVGGAFNRNVQVDLSAAPYYFGGSHVGHSFQFRLDYCPTRLFWNQLLVNMRLKGSQ
jgi:pimeloyl-ACP methyl ester carboxylesterase